MNKTRLLAISAGQYNYKKEMNTVKSHIRYLNYGLLGLVTMLDELGVEVGMAQGDNYTPDELIKRMDDAGLRIGDCDCILLSIPSYYSISWCADFCRTVREVYGKRIVVGGRWVVDNNTEWVREKLVYVDLIIEGFGERKLAELFCPERASEVADGATRCFGHLNYGLLMDYMLYQPSIEISRGCGRGCSFCADAHNKRIMNKPISEVVAELEYLDSTFGDYNFYLEAPHFNFNKSWCEEFAAAVAKRGKIIPWRCTTRVESMPTEMIGMLAKTGMKIIDIGLESASPTQLINMGKTKNPEKYLAKAVRILEECHKRGVWVKFNILLFAGETQETVRETVEWLTGYKHLIKGLGVSTLVYYKGAGELSNHLGKGASVPEGQSVEENGYANLNLSDELPLAKAKEYALEISRLVMSARDYYDIKSISYFERGYTYEDFAREVSECDWRTLTFRVE